LGQVEEKKILKTCISMIYATRLSHGSLKGLSIPEVALISDHRDVRMLFRYTHLKAEDVVNKL